MAFSEDTDELEYLGNYDDIPPIAAKMMYSICTTEAFGDLTKVIIEADLDYDFARKYQDTSNYIHRRSWELLLTRCDRLEHLEVKTIHLGPVVLPLSVCNYHTHAAGMVHRKNLKVLRLSHPPRTREGDQLKVLEVISHIIAVRDPNSGESYSTHPISEVVIGMSLEDPVASQIDESLDGWKRCGVKKGSVINSGKYYAGFGEHS